MSCHFDRVVDFFTALAMRNAAHARRTVFVARKRFLDRIKARVEAVSAALGRPLNCVLASPGKSFDGCRPTDIPLINYGIVGVNSLEAFDALYCIGGYYARADHLNAVYQQALPPDSRMPIGIRMEGRRRPGLRGRLSVRHAVSCTPGRGDAPHARTPRRIAGDRPGASVHDTGRDHPVPM